MIKKQKNQQITVRFKNSTDPRVIEFLNMQENMTDTITYLIEEELRRNGMRNLQKIIPTIRELPEELPGEKKMENVEQKTFVNHVDEESLEINDCFDD